MQQILVTGAGGQLGKELQELSKKFPDYNFIFADRATLDISDENMLRNIFNLNRFNYCINCAAYTAVDKAEEEHEQAFKINADAVETLAKVCKENDVLLFHISTDFVFDGEKGIPYKEDDATTPKSAYGQSKLEGEKKALAATDKIILIRTSWVYSHYGKNFVKTMLRLAQERDQLTIVSDQIGSPTHASDLAAVIMHIIDSGKAAENTGIYHFSNEGVCSWYDFALAIFELMKMDVDVKPIESKDFPTPAKRPHFSVLNKSKIKNTFEIEIPYWRDSLKECLTKLLEEDYCE